MPGIEATRRYRLLTGTLFLLCALASLAPAVARTAGHTAADQLSGTAVPSNGPKMNEDQSAAGQFPPLFDGTGESKFVRAIQRNMQPRHAEPVGLRDGDQFDLNVQPTGPRLEEEQDPTKRRLPNHNVPNQCTGFILPDGRYSWANCPKMGMVQAGIVPNPTLTLPGDPALDLPASSAVNDPFFEHVVEHTVGLPVHAHSAAVTTALAEVYRNSLANGQRGHEAQIRQMMQVQTAQNADNNGKACQANLETAFKLMSVRLINVANEENGSAPKAGQPFKSESEAIGMVQQMFKRFYLPLAILLLLPGAVLTQVKGMITAGMLTMSGKTAHDEDSISPFQGIFRAVIAVFLIPATQLVVSYCIDTGNTLAFTVERELEKNGRIEKVAAWMKQQAFATNPALMDNFFREVRDSGDLSGPTDAARGKVFNASAESTVQELENNVTTAIQSFFNTANNLMSEGLLVLNAFQLVMICYLFLLGPIAASLYVWPSLGKDLFKHCFANWLDGVVVLSLWKFWWCIVVLCMAVRLEYQAIDPTSQYELYYFTAFMVILAVVPFNPFSFHPGQFVSQLLDRAHINGAGGGAPSGGSKPAAPATSGGGAASEAGGGAASGTTPAAGAPAGTASGADAGSTASRPLVADRGAGSDSGTGGGEDATARATASSRGAGTGATGASLALHAAAQPINGFISVPVESPPMTRTAGPVAHGSSRASGGRSGSAKDDSALA